MLVFSFSIGVEKDYAEGVAKKLDDYGVELLKSSFYENGKNYSGKLTPMIWFDCYAPKARLEMAIDYFENEYEETTVILQIS